MIFHESIYLQRNNYQRVMARRFESMKTFTTKLAAELVADELDERSRQLGLVVLENQSSDVCVEATSDEIEDYERMSGELLGDDDVIENERLLKLVEWLRREKLLEKS